MAAVEAAVEVEAVAEVEVEVEVVLVLELPVWAAVLVAVVEEAVARVLQWECGHHLLQHRVTRPHRPLEWASARHTLGLLRRSCLHQRRCQRQHLLRLSLPLSPHLRLHHHHLKSRVPIR